MEEFKNNIYNIYDLINTENNEKSLINTKILSKQYLAYYIYRIMTKYILLVEASVTKDDIDFFMSLYRIPREHNKRISYPMAGKMTNENDILDMIIIGSIDIFDKINNYLKTLNKKNKQLKYNEFYIFLNEKKLPVIIKDLIDLQKLLPGLSVPIIRPNYFNNNNK
jgi:hypothetical protein